MLLVIGVGVGAAVGDPTPMSECKFTPPVLPNMFWQIGSRSTVSFWLALNRFHVVRRSSATVWASYYSLNAPGT